MGFSGVQSAEFSVAVNNVTAPYAPKVANSPRCIDGATSIDDCPDDPAYNLAHLVGVVWLTCTQSEGAGSPFG